MSAKLDKDLKDKKVNVSIFAGKSERNTTRYPRAMRVYGKPGSELQASIAGNVITLGGTPTAPGALTAVIDGVPFSVGIQTGSTLETLATALAQVINQSRPAISLGTTLAIQNAQTIIVKRSTVGKLGQELRRQERHFTISVWAFSPDSRAATAKLIDLALTEPHWIVLPDGSAGRIRYINTMDHDEPQKSLEYRRDIVYAVEYPTVKLIDGHEVMIATRETEGGQHVSPSTGGSHGEAIITTNTT
ncbi:MAG: hypothetical protein ABL901_02965 [Hyphomicrobiaceae bacterium]